MASSSKFSFVKRATRKLLRKTKNLSDPSLAGPTGTTSAVSHLYMMRTCIPPNVLIVAVKHDLRGGFCVMPKKR